jgi:hypothetical protein
VARNNGPTKQEWIDAYKLMDPVDGGPMLLIGMQRARHNVLSGTAERIGAYRGINVITKPIAIDLDRAVRRAGYDPNSRDGRLYQLGIGWRILIMGTLANILCTIATPNAAPLLAACPVFWVVHFINDCHERSMLAKYG